MTGTDSHFHKNENEMLDARQNDLLQKKIDIYKGAICTLEAEISNEKFGLVLDSGGHRPWIVNDEKVKRLEESLKEVKRKLAELQKTE